MSVQSRLCSEKPSAVLLSFRDKFAVSPQFKELFREGMALVEETADYLDRAGRIESKALTPPSNLAFTSQSMQLTTRLMQIASWLLMRRAVANGDLTSQDASNHKRSVRLSPQSRDAPDGFDALPPTFVRLIEHSHRLHERICRLDQMMNDTSARPEPALPVGQSVERLRLAYPA